MDLTEYQKVYAAVSGYIQFIRTHIENIQPPNGSKELHQYKSGMTDLLHSIQYMADRALNFVSGVSVVETDEEEEEENYPYPDANGLISDRVGLTYVLLEMWTDHCNCIQGDTQGLIITAELTAAVINLSGSLLGDNSIHSSKVDASGMNSKMEQHEKDAHAIIEKRGFLLCGSGLQE